MSHKSLKIILVFIISLLCTTIVEAQYPTSSTSNSLIPHLERKQSLIQLIIDGKPFVLISGELHNSSSSSPQYLAEAIRNAKQMNVNSVIASISWEQFEPNENKFDFKLIDYLIQTAEKNNLKVVLIWFASWKNGESFYPPLWVKRDVNRFYRLKNKNGDNTTTISPFCEAAMEEDGKAFNVLMNRIRQKDLHHHIVMMQVENEVGAFSEMDYNPKVIALYNKPVPTQLISYLVTNKNNLDTQLRRAWESNGSKTKGNWRELFGEKNLVSQSYFMTWQYASYINEVCKLGKQAYNIPMYVNAWQEQYATEPPGKYPNGGPVSKVIDVYKAAGPYIDFISPDIYLPTFKEICSNYSQPLKDNPLFIPECDRTNPGKAYYAIAEKNAIGFAPFGIESMVSDLSYAQSFKVLKEMLPTIVKYQGTGKMHGYLKEGNEDSTIFEMGKYKVIIEYYAKTDNAYGVIIQTGDNDFIVSGINSKIMFYSRDEKLVADIGEVLEGAFKADAWTTYRQLNGDEGGKNFIDLKKRNFSVSLENGRPVLKPFLAPIQILNEPLEKRLESRTVQAPGVFKLNLYQYPKY